MVVDLKALQEAEDMFGTGYQESDGGMDETEVKTETIGSYVKRIIKDNKLSTMGIDYIGGTAFVTVKTDDETTLAKFNIGTDAYYRFCFEVLEIDESESYSTSISLRLEGVSCRVFSLMPPVVEMPIITISTTKPIPGTVVPSNLKNVLTNELLDKIVHSNFVVGGGSGSGKTYFLNALLGNFIRDDERVGLVQEFNELTPPNKLTLSITTPPAKPGQEPLLRWTTEASNLMRLDLFVVGEIKGREAFPFLVNVSSGTHGIATVHGKDARSVLSRLTSLALLESDNKKSIEEFISKGLDYVIVMRKHQIFQIVELQSTVTNGNFAMKSLYVNDALKEEDEVIR